jgi:membrane-associated phospholipid phosphatase
MATSKSDHFGDCDAMSADASVQCRPAVSMPVCRAMRPFGLLLVPLGLLAAALAAFSVDCSLADWCKTTPCPRFFHDLFHYAEPFGHGWGVLLLVAVVFVLDPTRRWALPRVLSCALLSGLVADGLKMLIARARPHHFDFSGDVWTTFGGWFPLTSAGSVGQSFPSAHTATAVGFALALSWLYPNGRRLFPLLAALVACQRIESGAHFLSDVLCGAATGYLVATALLRVGPLPRCFEYWEQRWKSAAAGNRDTTSAA